MKILRISEYLVHKLTSCEYCGGSANWTVYAGQLYFWCKAECSEFRQVEMFQDVLTRHKFGVRFDKLSSVSALDEDEDEDALPF